MLSLQHYNSGVIRQFLLGHSHEKTVSQYRIKAVTHQADVKQPAAIKHNKRSAADC